MLRRLLLLPLLAGAWTGRADAAEPSFEPEPYFIDGIVVDDSGRPQAGAVVVAGPADPEPAPGVRLAQLARATCGGDGRFRIPGLVPGTTYAVMHLARADGVSHVVRAAPWGESEIEPEIVIQVRQGRPLAGRLINEDGQGVAGWVDAAEHDWGRGYRSLGLWREPEASDRGCPASRSARASRPRTS